MTKETEERLIRTLEFLKEPRGSTITTLVKVMNGEGPQVSLKKVVQTLRGCLENGILQVSDGRVKLKQMNVLSDQKDKDEKMLLDDKHKAGYGQKPGGSAKMLQKKNWKAKPSKPPAVRQLATTVPTLNKADDASPPGEENGGEQTCPECPVCKKKKPKPKCPKPKPKCPKPKPKCPKPKPKCPKKKKPTCQKKKKPKSNKKKCAAKKVKIQPYCKKKKKCPP